MKFQESSGAWADLRHWDCIAEEKAESKRLATVSQLRPPDKTT